MNINPLNFLYFGNITVDTKTKSVASDTTVIQKPLSSDTVEISKNPISMALEKLKELKFSDEDIKKVSRWGTTPIFKDGLEAANFAKENNISIIFGQVDQPDIHAQWVNDKRSIIINDRYKNTKDDAEILAISAALLHELSHAKDNDGASSIQEELDCLAMNALAFNFYEKKYPELFKNTSSPIINDGVALYTKLFWNDSPNDLKKRIKLKYGNLGVESPNHPAAYLAHEISNMQS